MKNRKGYTLIEILAVVIILGILLLIAVPAVNKQLNKFRNDYYDKLETSLQSAGKDFISDKRYGKPTKLLHSKIVKAEELENDGYISDITDYLGEKCDTADTSYSYVIVVKTGEKSFEYASCLRCSEDEYYTDTSGKKNDFCNAAWLTNDNITYENSTYNSEFLYVYEGSKTESELKKQVGITYNIVKKDENGNVLAEVVPEDEDEVLYPKNMNELIHKNLNEKIDLVYELPDGTEYIKSAMIYKHYSPKITMKYVNANKFTGKTANSEYKSGEWASKIAISLEYSDSDVDLVRNSKSIDHFEYYDESDNKWHKISCTISNNKCTWTLGASEDFAKDIKIRLVNNDGFASDASSEIEVRVDKTAPEITLKATGEKNGEWFTDNAIITFDTLKDNLSGVGKYDITTSSSASYNNVNKMTLSSDTSNITYYGYVMDKAGNVSSDSINIKRDTTPPSVPMITNPTNGNWTNANFSLTVTASDTDSGVDYWYYSYDNKNWTRYDESQGKTTYTTPAFSAERNQLVYIRVCDKLGYCSVNSTYIRIDKTKPRCTISTSGTVGANSWYTTDVGFKLNRYDDQHSSTNSGIDSYNLTTSASASYSGNSSLTLNTDTSSRTYYGYVKDKAGNTNKCSVTVKRDATKPSCSVTPSGTVGTNNWYTSNVSFALSTSDDTSKVASYNLSTSSSASYSGTTSLTLSSDTSSKTYYGYVKDNAGNTNKCSVTVKRDATKPSCSSTKTGEGASGVSASFSCSDNLSDVASCPSAVSGLKKTTSYTVKDKAGNTNTCNVPVASKTQYRKRTCASGKRCESAGCETYKSCANSACGAKTCATAACGYNSCATSGCGVASYKTCENSACGAKTCRHSDCGVESYKTCENSACGAKTCRHSDCGVESYNTCANSACGVASYKTCQNAACGYSCSRSGWYVAEGDNTLCYKAASCTTTSICKNGGTVSGNYCVFCFSDGNTCISNSPSGFCYAEATGSSYCYHNGTPVSSSKCSCSTGSLSGSWCYISSTMNSCATSACGVASYKSCATSACGVASYKSCATAACGYNSCATSACGVSSYKSCATAACGYNSCATSACGVASYKTCENSACGAKTCEHSDCGYKTCRTSGCGCETYKVSITSCGCDSWNSYSSWSDASSNYCTTTNSCQGETRTYYY